MDPPPIPGDSPHPGGEPSFWRELADGTAGPVVRTMVTFGLAVCMTGLSALLCYVLAALVPPWSRGGGSYGVYPSDELVAGVAVVAGGAFVAASAWLWSRSGKRWRGIVAPAIYTVAIVVATTVVCLLVENSIHGDKDFLFSGFIMLGAGGIVLVWAARIYRIRRGRPITNQSDGQVNVRCPNCGYRMVGLRESRCPECGTQYTLDELLAKQDFSRV